MQPFWMDVFSISTTMKLESNVIFSISFYRSRPRKVSVEDIDDIIRPSTPHRPTTPHSHRSTTPHRPRTPHRPTTPGAGSSDTGLGGSTFALGCQRCQRIYGPRMARSRCRCRRTGTDL